MTAAFVSGFAVGGIVVAACALVYFWPGSGCKRGHHHWYRIDAKPGVTSQGLAARACLWCCGTEPVELRPMEKP